MEKPPAVAINTYLLWTRLSPEMRRRAIRGIRAVALRGTQATAALSRRVENGTVAAALPHVVHRHTFRSAALGRTMPYVVLLPAGYTRTMSYPVLYVLHGAWSDYTQWTTRTHLPRDLAPYPMIVVCPEGENGCYLDGANGEQWEEYLVRDLPAHIETRYAAHTDRGGRAIAGLSMGGFGAFNAALRHPERYAAVSSLSGAFMLHDGPHIDDPQFAAVWGAPDSPQRAMYDPQQVAAAAARMDTDLPAIAFDCGAGDFPNLLAANRALDTTLTRLGIPHTYRERTGSHNWAYWSRELPWTLRFVAAAMGIA